LPFAFPFQETGGPRRDKTPPVTNGDFAWHPDYDGIRPAPKKGAAFLMPRSPDADAGEASVRLRADHQALRLPRVRKKADAHATEMDLPDTKSSSRALQIPSRGEIRCSIFCNT
jgi:hypothetical protein